MDNPKEDEEEIIVVQARRITEREIFYLEWGKELIKNQFNLANELLKQIIGTCIALMGASVIFTDLFEKDVKLKFFSVLLFFLALIVACVGLFPFSRKDVWFDSPSEIEKFKTDALSFKRKCYTISGVFVIMGLAIIICKVFLQAFSD